MVSTAVLVSLSALNSCIVIVGVKGFLDCSANWAPVIYTTLSWYVVMSCGTSTAKVMTCVQIGKIKCRPDFSFWKMDYCAQTAPLAKSPQT
jgi:hypothetical protein